MLLNLSIDIAQLRDLFTSENSAVVPQEGEDHARSLPQLAQPDFHSGRVRESKIRESFCEVIHNGCHLEQVAFRYAFDFQRSIGSICNSVNQLHNRISESAVEFV